MHEAIFRAFFQRGEDIGDSEVLVGVASDLGLEGESLRRALHAQEFREKVLQDERAGAALGVNGVPAYVVGGRVARTGVQATADLTGLLQEVRRTAQ
jgi:predicted DsbA family dithiol-disulfide isomerase